MLLIKNPTPRKVKFINPRIVYITLKEENELTLISSKSSPDVLGYTITKEPMGSTNINNSYKIPKTKNTPTIYHFFFGITSSAPTYVPNNAKKGSHTKHKMECNPNGLPRFFSVKRITKKSTVSPK